MNVNNIWRLLHTVRESCEKELENEHTEKNRFYIEGQLAAIDHVLSIVFEISRDSDPSARIGNRPEWLKNLIADVMSDKPQEGDLE